MAVNWGPDSLLWPALIGASGGLLGVQPGQNQWGAGFQGLLGGMQMGQQLQQAQQLGQLNALRVAEAKRKAEQEEQQRQANARLMARLMGATDMARNPQLASADGASGVPTQVRSVAELTRDPAAFADLVAASGGNPLTALQAIQNDTKPVVVGPGGALVDPSTGRPVFQNPRTDRPTELDILFQRAGIDPSSPEGQRIARDILMRKGQPMSVKVDNLGNIPPGYELFTTPDGARQMRPIPGSPAAAAAARDAKAEQERSASQQRTTDIVTQDIDRALALLERNPSLVAGVGGLVLSRIPGTVARDFAALVDTVKANAGFEKLQAMRDASPTGGALGQVTERELAFLQATIGNLEQSQSPQQLKDNLRRVKNAYLDIIHGPGNGPAREKLGFERKGDTATSGSHFSRMSLADIVKVDVSKLTPDQREAFSKRLTELGY